MLLEKSTTQRVFIFLMVVFDGELVCVNQSGEIKNVIML